MIEDDMTAEEFCEGLMGLVQELVASAGGTVRSRQIVATVTVLATAIHAHAALTFDTERRLRELADRVEELEAQAEARARGDN